MGAPGQEITKTMASSPLAYAAEPFGVVSVSLRPISPNTIKVLAVSIVFGGLFGVIISLVRVAKQALNGAHMRLNPH